MKKSHRREYDSVVTQILGSIRNLLFIPFYIMGISLLDHLQWETSYEIRQTQIT